MLRSFKSKGLKRFAETGDGSKLPVPNHERVRQILLALNAATRPEAMNIPGLRFHPLKGDRKGRYAVTASGNYRITFAFEGEDAVQVDLEDYHGR
jgi:proteic killer suppression protein